MSVKCPHCGEQLDIVRARHRTFDHEQALALLRFGATVSEVAAEYGVSRERIYQLVRKTKS